MKNVMCTMMAMLAMTVAADETQRTIKVDPATRFQTVEGWGASLCWWAHMAGLWDDAKIDEVIDWLTAPDKLNMTLFRYNIGGGDDPAHYSKPGQPGHMAKGKGVRAEMEGFKPSAGAPYNWNADAGQRKIMLKIKAKRPDAVFEAFANSPPYWMTHSGCSGGNDPATADNLKPEFYDAFCDYLVDVCKHYKQRYGLEFRTLEPFNESLSSYWPRLGSQEGCHFDAASQIRLIKRLHPKLRASGLRTVIAASDETSLGDCIKALKAYAADGATLPLVAQINTHTYHGNNAQRVNVRELCAQAGKRLWQSETGPIGIKSRGLKNNVALARRLVDDMRLLRPTAWLDWQYIEEHGDTWCMVRGDFAKQTYSRVKNYYVRMQFSRFIRSGCVVIDADDERVLAAVTPKGDGLVLCMVNESEGEQTFTFDLSAFNRTGAAMVYRTDAQYDCERGADVSAADGRLSIRVGGVSVATACIPVVR